MRIIMSEKTTPTERFIKLPEVMNKTGLGRSTIYASMKAGDFPKSIQLNKKNSVWLESEINDWMTDKINKRNQKGEQE